jgi:rfaE bifunctional protein nucleotidyltransferase chain/domain
MAISNGIFGYQASSEERIVSSLDELAQLVTHLKGIGLRIVLTSGSFDLIHLGHVKYLTRAKALGDVLVVGVDSDAKIRARKGANRPLVPEGERLEMLAYQRPVDLLFLKNLSDLRWALIRAVQPDALVLTEDHSYSSEELEELDELCGEKVVLGRQAEITTSERIRQINIGLGSDLAAPLGKKLAEILPELIHDIVSGQ